MMLKRIALAAGLLLGMMGAASAQCTGTFAANQFCGSLTGGPPGPRSITSGVINMQAGTLLGNAGTSAANASDLRAPVLGLNGTAQGSLGLRGSTSGTVTIQPGAAAAGTYNFNLPTSAGTAGAPMLSGGGGSNPQTYGILGLAFGGTNNALTASNGGLVYSDAFSLQILAGTATAGQIPRSGASAAPGWSTATYPGTAAQGTILAAGTANVISASATPVLGIPGTTMGTLGLAGSTSGTVTITPQATAGSPTLTLPNASGTFAVSASSPLLVSATTGNVTCPTCVTSSGGGAITGTSPISVSAAGVVSLATPLALNFGGTAANLTAANGGVVYSSSSALAILAPTATASQHLQSGANAAPSWTTATYPATAAVGTLLAAGSANTITATATPTLGANSGTGGQITFNGSTSGSAALRVAAAAGTSTIFQLPSDNGTNGFALTTNGSGITSWTAVAGTGTVTSVATAGMATGGTFTTTGTVTVTAASQADQEAGSSTTNGVTPGRQQFHPSALKAFAYCTQSAGAYTLAASYNIAGASCGKSGTGLLTLTFSTAFSSSSFACTATGRIPSTLAWASPTAANTVAIELRNLSSANVDGDFSVMCAGDQ